MITWSDNYLMGIEQFDQEHKQIFKLAGQILERMRTWDNEKRVRMFVMREAIIYLNDYFENHVRAEEAYAAHSHPAKSKDFAGWSLDEGAIQPVCTCVWQRRRQ